MSWFKILKENKLISQNITHTRVDENKPEQSDDNRCKEALKKILRNLERLYNQNNSSFGVSADWESADSNKREKTGSPPFFYKDGGGSFDAIIEIIDDEFSEELCCVALEQFKKLERAGKDWLNDNSFTTMHDAEMKDFVFKEQNKSGGDGISSLYADCYASINQVKETHGLWLDEEIMLSFSLSNPRSIKNFDTDRLHFTFIYFVNDIFQKLIKDGVPKEYAHITAVWAAMEDIVVTIGPGAGMI